MKKSKALNNHIRTVSVMGLLVMAVVLIVHFPHLLWGVPILIGGIFTLMVSVMFYCSIYQLMENLFGGNDDS